MLQVLTAVAQSNVSHGKVVNTAEEFHMQIRVLPLVTLSKGND